MGRARAALALAACLGVLSGCGGGGADTTARTTPPPRLDPHPPFRPSPTGAFWSTPLADDAPLDPRSDALVGSLVQTVDTTTASGRPPWISIQTCADRVYEVPADQPVRPVVLDRPATPGNASLRAALTAVPIPTGARPSDCPDRVIVILQPSRDRMWELWHARLDADGWHAEWGGATRRAAENTGSYGPADWPGATTYWGVSASSMTLYGGLIRPEELAAGHIDHAIALSLPEVSATDWAAPAERTDGSLTDPEAIPYGARFRLDPALDVDALHVPRATKIIAAAAQRYGFVVRESTHCCVILNAEAPPPGHALNPYLRLLRGTPGEILSGFPWRRLQLMRMDLQSG